MTIVILPSPAAGKTRLAYQNVLADPQATVTCDDGAVDGFNFQQAYDWNSATYWKPATGGTHYIQAVLPATRQVNYFAIYAQNLSANGGSASLQYSTDYGITWNTACTVTPPTSAPQYITFEPIMANSWRAVTSSAVASQVGVISFGLDFTLQRGAWVGRTPPILGRAPDLTTIISDNGAFIGRSVKRANWQTNLDLDFLTPEWVRSYWLPFMTAIETQPFFMLWNPVDYPGEASFCWIDQAKNIMPPKYSRQRYMSAGLSSITCRQA